MPKLQTITTNFTAGEFAPRLRARVDLDKYNASAEELRNCVVLRQGGVTIRPPFKFLGSAKFDSGALALIPFVFSREDAYVIEMHGGGLSRFWKNGQLIEASPGVPYEALTFGGFSGPSERLDYASQGDTMIFVGGFFYRPWRLRRFADNDWRNDPAPLNPGPMAENGLYPVSNITFSAATGSGVTATAAEAGTFRTADVGRTISLGGGLATITGYTSGTVVTVNITSALPAVFAGSGDWRINGTPQATITPSADSPVGATITLTLGAAGWRPGDVGNWVQVNGGYVKITVYTSDTVVSGVITKELVGFTAAPADAWVLLTPVFNANDGYPQAVTFYQGRLWFASTRRYPQSIWGSKSGLFFDFTPGGVDDGDAIYKTIDSDDQSPIEYLRGVRNLGAFSLGREFEIRGSVDKPITPTSTDITPQSRYGCERVRPENAATELLFVQRAGKVIRAITQEGPEGFISRDISVFSDHLLRQGVRCMSFQQSPEQVLWIATSDGKLVAVTYNPEQNTVAFCSGETDGGVEWLATIPEGGEDVTYAQVRRTIDGVDVRYIETLHWGDWLDTERIENPHDSFINQTFSPAETVIANLGHLEGKTVSVKADGVKLSGPFVVTGGEITLPNPASEVSVGIPYTARIKIQPPEVGTGTGTSQGQAVSTHITKVRFYKTQAANVNGEDTPFRQLDTNILDSPPPVFSGIQRIQGLGWRDGEDPLIIEQREPYPWTVLGIIREFTVNPG